MNYITETIMECYKNKFPQSSTYLQEKREKLSQVKSIWDSIGHLESLDASGRRHFSHLADIRPEDIEALIRVYQTLYLKV
ncbi:hypothetical protein [Marinobacter sp.]|uniref:hypothetical protein n=1 Tax=Marinobacter sp. TaxID=50741 RepID=UPI0035C7381F